MPEHQCLKCGYEWLSHLERPKACPGCKNYKWDEPKINKEDKE